mmetsp:Transcript_52086/g.166873  ORF Transcript_52086/g.166873 Transcript_52086/m.166873 type:complete len:86 (-) Transcript_52086:115-372(-)
MQPAEGDPRVEVPWKQPWLQPAGSSLGKVLLGLGLQPAGSGMSSGLLGAAFETAGPGAGSQQPSLPGAVTAGNGHCSREEYLRVC